MNERNEIFEPQTIWPLTTLFLETNDGRRIPFDWNVILAGRIVCICISGLENFPIIYLPSSCHFAIALYENRGKSEQDNNISIYLFDKLYIFVSFE